MNLYFSTVLKKCVSFCKFSHLKIMGSSVVIDKLLLLADGQKTQVYLPGKHALDLLHNACDDFENE